MLPSNAVALWKLPSVFSFYAVVLVLVTHDPSAHYRDQLHVLRQDLSFAHRSRQNVRHDKSRRCMNLSSPLNPLQIHLLLLRLSERRSCPNPSIRFAQ